VEAVALGFVVGASFGPANVEFTRRVLLGGLRGGLPFAMGALAGDITSAALWIVIGGRLMASEWYRDWSGTASIVFGLVLLFVALRSMRRGHVVARTTTAVRNAVGRRGVSGFLFGLLITGASPLSVLLWATVTATALRSLAPQPYAQVKALLLLAVGDTMWFSGWTVAMTMAHYRLSAGSLRMLGNLAACVLAFFAAVTIARGILR
jgi:threonine/homoserine/homoserine lactone efflux protein